MNGICIQTCSIEEKEKQLIYDYQNFEELSKHDFEEILYCNIGLYGIKCRELSNKLMENFLLYIKTSKKYKTHRF